MKSYWRWLFLLILFVSACAQGTAEIRPPDIRYGEDVCAECNMIISDPRFAAAYARGRNPRAAVRARGDIQSRVRAREAMQNNAQLQQLAFDDIGDMLLYATKHPEQKIVGSYVHDYQTEEWLDAADAHFVISSAIATPMGHGIAAFATEENAQAFALETRGEMLTWDALQARGQNASLHLHKHSDSHPSNVQHSAHGTH